MKPENQNKQQKENRKGKPIFRDFAQHNHQLYQKRLYTMADRWRIQSNQCQDIKKTWISAHHIAKGYEKTRFANVAP